MVERISAQLSVGSVARADFGDVFCHVIVLGQHSGERRW